MRPPPRSPNEKASTPSPRPERPDRQPRRSPAHRTKKTASTPLPRADEGIDSGDERLRQPRITRRSQVAVVQEQSGRQVGIDVHSPAAIPPKLGGDLRHALGKLVTVTLSCPGIHDPVAPR